MASGAPAVLPEVNNHLAIHLYRILSKERKNVFFSPFSVSTALAMLLSGSEGKTADEMMKVLGYEETKVREQDIKLSFQSFLNALKDSAGGDYTLMRANLVVCQEEFAVKGEFKSYLEEFFDATFEAVDFANESEMAVQRINNWVKEKTENMIPEFIDTLDTNTVMLLLNAVYFKGLWLNQFKEADTSQQDFYNGGVASNAKRVGMMHLKEKFPYLEKESFTALQLPYRGEHISMLILLPKSMNGLEEMESSLDPTSIRDLLKDMGRTEEVNVALPKFRLEYSKSLREHFQSLGMKRLFEPGADFGGISDSKELLISDIFHKAVIEVNEEGSEAAAATGVVMTMLSLPLVQEFVVDHPFLFAICDSNSKLIIFMGRVNEL